MDRRIHLKIKIKSLAAEAKIIRHEARRLDKVIKDRQVAGGVKQVLNGHRKWPVGHEARHSLLAYALIRDKPYEIVEQKCYEAPSWKKVSELAKRFGAKEADIAAWIALAKKYVKDQDYWKKRTQ